MSPTMKINASITGEAKLSLVRAVRGRRWFAAGGLFVFIFIASIQDPAASPPGPEPDRAAPAPAQSTYARPDSAPNGQPWPAAAGYVRGYQRLHSNGHATVTVDNGRNDFDVFVKLVSVDGHAAYAARVFYIPAHGRFTLGQMTAGRYDVRYRDLESGALFQVEAFNLEEASTAGGAQSANFTIMLYEPPHGNVRIHRLSEIRF